jgi:hypothetical protein
LRTQTSKGPWNPLTDHREEITRSNLASIRARLVAIRAARESEEALQLEALPVAEVEQRIVELRRSIPAVSEELE